MYLSSYNGIEHKENNMQKLNVGEISCVFFQTVGEDNHCQLAYPKIFCCSCSRIRKDKGRQHFSNIAYSPILVGLCANDIVLLLATAYFKISDFESSLNHSSETLIHRKNHVLIERQALHFDRKSGPRNRISGFCLSFRFRKYSASCTDTRTKNSIKLAFSLIARWYS